MKRLTLLLLPFLTVATGFSAAFSGENLVVVQVGTGAALNNVSTAVNLIEFTTSGSLIQTIALPTSLSGGNNPLTLQGSATSEGFLKRSVDGNYLTLIGYGTGVGTTGPSGVASATINRVVGRIDMSGNVDTTTALTDAYSAGTVRGAVSTDGNSLWLSGSVGGVRSSTLGSTTSTSLNATPPNTRVVDIYNGQLYVDSGSGGFTAPSTVGTGTPTTAGQTVTPLPGFTTSSRSPYDYWFKDANTLYVADDGSVANLGGIQKWTLSAGTWTLQYTLLNNGTTTTAVRGLIGTVDNNGDAVLFGTTGTALITVTDPGVNVFTATTLATAASGYAFRGIAMVPEPSSAALLLVGAAGLFLRRRL
jgi:hypothetical protein